VLLGVCFTEIPASNTDCSGTGNGDLLEPLIFFSKELNPSSCGCGSIISNINEHHTAKPTQKNNKTTTKKREREKKKREGGSPLCEE
jgi:hypothetical protein